VPLQDPVEGRDIARDVVDDLALRRALAAQEHAAHADERLGIGLVRHRRDHGDEAPRQLLLAADIGRGGMDRAHPAGAFIHRDH